MDIIYQHLSQQQIGPALFTGFDRWQNVTRCWRKENGSWVLRDIAFIDDWSEEEYTYLYDCLKNTLNTGGDVIAALEGNRLLGFASVENQPFGPQNEYRQLSSLHVSNGMRGHGIGSHLFAMSCLAAAQRGAKKLYLSGHSAEETQAFYRAMGCVEAAWYHSELVAAEPCDCQLERQLCNTLPFPGEDAEETQAFYRAMGCVEAAWYHSELVAAEPCDCQLERQLCNTLPFPGEDFATDRTDESQATQIFLREVSCTESILSQLIGLSQEWEEEGSIHGYHKNEPDDIEGNRIFAAFRGEQMIGYLFGKMQETQKDSSIMPAGTHCFEIEEIYVQPALRSSGIGSRLFQLAQLAVTGEAQMLTLSTSTKNYQQLAVTGEAQMLTLSTSTKNYQAILHFYIEQMGMQFWNARLFKPL